MHDEHTGAEAPHGASGAGYELRPRRNTFIGSRVFPPLLAILVLGGAAGVGVGVYFAAPAPVAAVVATCLLLAALVVYGAVVAYRKERYVFHDAQIVASRGGLLSDEQARLNVRNITHVKLRLPWLRYKLFRVGDVFIESAGSSESAVRLRTIVDPEAAYARVQELMRRNGFSLQGAELLHEEQPDPLGVVVECLGIAVTALIAVGFAVLEVLGGELVIEQANWITYVFLVLGPGAALFGLLTIGFHYLDLRRRTYRVYTDAIFYEEGFLTRENAFIPAENLADSSTKRTFIDQVLGLYDVEVSCQGSGQEIHFRRLRRGPELSDAIDQVVATQRAAAAAERERPPVAAAAGEAPGDVEEGEGPAGERVLPADARGAPAPRRVAAPSGPAWTADLKMHMGRAVVPLVLLCAVLPPLIPLWILAIVGLVIQVSVTSYQVRAGSVRSVYRFLTTSEREFSNDKVTGVVVREGPFDRLFKTVTVQLWSIGAPMPLDLLHVRRDELDLPALLRQVGIPADQPVSRAGSSYSLGAAFKAHLPLALTGALSALAVALLALLVEGWLALLLVPMGLALLGLLLYWRALYPRAQLVLHEGHAELREGLLVRRTYRARYEAIKKLVLTRYPGSDMGSVQLFVAGEQRVGAAQGKGGAAGAAQGVVVPYSFTLRYAERLSALGRALDEVLERGAGPEQAAVLEGRAAPERVEPLRSGTPAAANAVAVLVLVSLLLLPLAALLPLTIPWTLYVVRRRRYVVEPRRVVARTGIVYRVQASILHSRIDTLRRAQGPLNKLFKNGKVTLFTAGSSQPDLVLANLPDYEAFHEAVERHYGS